MKRDIWLVGFGLVIGLLATGVLLLLAGKPRGQPVTLLPPPTPKPILIYVSGAVAHPGVYTLSQESRLQDALQAAGGLLAEANPQSLNLAARLQDGDKIVVPTQAPTSAAPGAASSRSQPLTGLDPSNPTEPQTGHTSDKININTATLEELDSLPGIGPVIAQRIIDYRQEHGPFQSIEAIMDVSGIGQATFERIKDLITIGE